MAGISTLSQSLNQISRIQDLQTQLSTLERQLVSGKKANLFDGLGNGVITSQRTRASFDSLETFISNTKTADRRIDLMNVSINEIRAQTQNLQNTLSVQTQEGDLELDTIGGYARNLREFSFDLLNQQDGDRYLFAASDSANQPVSDNGTLDTFLDNQIQNWIDGTIDTDTFVDNITNRDVLDDSIVGYSAALSSGNTLDVTTRVDDRVEIDYTVRANEDAFRNLIVATAAFDRLDLALDDIAQDPGDPAGQITAPGADQAEQNENFFALFSELSNLLNEGLDQLDNSQFKLASAQTQIQQIRDSHEIEKNILLDQRDDVENIDINEVAVSLSNIQFQLEASFRVTAAISELSLVNFL